MKRIWIINYYTVPPAYTSNPRHLELSVFLKKLDYEVILIGASYLADRKINLIESNEKYLHTHYGTHEFIHIKVNSYIGNGLSRMLSIFKFGWNIRKYSKYFPNPDIVIHNIHMPFDYAIVSTVKKMNAKYIAEAWDLWPDSFVRFGLIGKNNPLTKIAYQIEKRTYYSADRIIFSFEGGINYLRQKKWTKDTGGKIDEKNVFYINNGVNLKSFQENIDLYKLDDQDLSNNDYYYITYIGSMQLVNDLIKVLDAAALLEKYKKIKFLLYGDGSDREMLEQYCVEKKISNVIFKEKWVPLKYIPYILSKSTLNIMNYQQNFGVYGVSSGKLFQYLAAGKPICANIQMNYCIITRNNIGVAKNFINAKEYSDAILSLLPFEPNSYNEMCKRVLATSKEFDFPVLFRKIIPVIEN